MIICKILALLINTNKLYLITYGLNMDINKEFLRDFFLKIWKICVIIRLRMYKKNAFRNTIKKIEFKQEYVSLTQY